MIPRPANGRRRRRIAIGAAIVGLALSSVPLPGGASGLSTFFGDSGQFIEISPKKPAPRIRFADALGRTRALEDFAGRVRLVNIWATWCPPCVREMPSLDRLQAELGGDDFQVVPISIDVPGATAVTPFYKAMGIAALPVFLDPRQEAVYTQVADMRADALPIYGLPISFFVDRAGRLLGYLVGSADWDGQAARGFLRHLMEASR